MKMQGIHADCIIHNEEVEATAITQVQGLLDHPAFAGLKIRIMSDIHAGAGAVIGFTSTLGDKIIPNIIGVDIGCGVISTCLGNVDIDYQALDGVIRKNIPSGFNVRNAMPPAHVWDDCLIDSSFLTRLESVCAVTAQKIVRVSLSLGSLGGGNHFIEVGEDELGRKWLTIHTGSRNFGLKVAQFHQKIAKDKTNSGDLSYLEGTDAELYVAHMKVAEEFSIYNRRLITNSIVKEMNWVPVETVESIHNYINFQDGIVRKGAISANKGQMVVIPWNMRDGLIIGCGKGNPDWNNSAPHGAGRVMGRQHAKRVLNLEEFKETMKGVWSSCVCQDTLDEAPMVYKISSEIEALLGPTVEVLHRVKPLYNFKAFGD
jgi:RNA-splicing ligase RtcB